jgi:hypothetical protein
MGVGSVAELPSVQLAAARYETLLTKVKTEKGGWHPRSWDLIEARLKDEAQFMHECDVSATCGYVFYVELACLYLTTFHRPEEFKRFMQIVTADVAKFGASATVADETEFTEGDKWILGISIQMFHLSVAQLRRLYPDTS